MRRSTFVLLGLAALGLVLGTFIIRGSTRLFLGDRISLFLALPVAALALVLVIALLIIAVLDRLGIYQLEDDLADSSDP